MRKGYPSDIKREQFKVIRPRLESARKMTAPRKVDLCEVLGAVLYLLKAHRKLKAMEMAGVSAP